MIYLVDNNDGNLGDWLYKAKIVYEQNASNGALFTYMKWVYNEDLKIKIMDLVLLDSKHSVNHVFSSPTSIINFTSKKPSYDDTRRSGRDNELLQRAQNDL